MTGDTSDTEGLLQFPCSFPIKVMGRDAAGFRDSVVAIVSEYAGTVEPEAVRASPSSKGNFVSVTITINAQNQQQLDDIYRALTAHDDVLVSL